MVFIRFRLAQSNAVEQQDGEQKLTYVVILDSINLPPRADKLLREDHKNRGRGNAYRGRASKLLVLLVRIAEDDS
eukprot:2603243-Rhodomonas_salina.1